MSALAIIFLVLVILCVVSGGLAFVAWWISAEEQMREDQHQRSEEEFDWDRFEHERSDWDV